MKFQTTAAESIFDMKKSAFNKAMDIVGITEREKLIDTPKEFNNVKQEAGRILAEQMLGRPAPLKKHPDMVRANMAVMKMGKSEPIPMYPRKVDTDEKRFIYLSDLYNSNQINQEIFVDLAEVLEEEFRGQIIDTITKKNEALIDAALGVLF